MSAGRADSAAGFTLLETLIGFSMFLVALTAVTMMLDSNRRSYVRAETIIEVQQNARSALGAMTSELRMAGYFPENFATPPAAPALGDAVQIATDDALAVYGDLDGSGSSSVFLYCLDGSLFRRGKGPHGDATAYWCPAGEVLAENVTRLRFAYFDADNLPLPAPPSAPYELDDQSPGAVPGFSVVAERSAVRRVMVTLTVTGQVPGHGAQVFELGSEVRLRNVR